MSWLDVALLTLGKGLHRVSPRLTSALALRYPYRRQPPPELHRLGKPLSQARVALITTAGLTLEGQPPFDMKTPLGDASFRLLPHTAPAEAFVLGPVGYDRTGIDADLEVALPRRALDRLVARGLVGRAAEHHLGFMGYVPFTRPLIRESAVAAAEVLLAQGVEVAVLGPV